MKLSIRALFATLGLWAFLLLPLSFARAGDPSEDLKEALLAAVVGMQQAGLQSVGGVSSEQIRREIRSISFHLVTKPFSPSTPYRECAYYDRGGRSVTLESQCWSRLSPQLGLALLFHEALGALGYDDVNYQWSAPLGYALTFSSIGFPRTLLTLALPTPIIPQLFEPAFRRRITEWARLKGGGSATGIKGGGDPSSLETKIALFGYLGLYAVHRRLSEDEFDRLWERIRFLRVESVDRAQPEVEFDGETLFVSRRFVRELETDRNYGPLIENLKPAAVLDVFLDFKP